MEFKQYPSYKNSGVEWLGDVPEHWQIVRTKDIFNHRKEEALEDDEIVTAFRDGQVTLRKNRRTDGFTNSIKEHGYQHINSGDLVIHEMDAFAGAIGVSDSSGKSTPVYSVCYAKNENINHHFYSHFFRTMAKTGFINSLAKGIRVRSTEFRWNESRNVYLALPPQIDQQKIVSFLNTETTRIDNLISKQEKLIELLEEQRKSIISHAVTKGLNPNAPMKDSGVEWLGEVPESWEVIPSKFYFTERKEKAVNGDKQLTASQKHGIIYQDEFIAENGRVMVVMKNPEILKKVRPNDFVISMRSFQGGLELSSLEGSISSAYVMLKPDLSLINTEYFKYLFKTPRYIQSLQSTSNLIRDGQALRFNNFSQVKLVLPPKSEQQEIVEYLDKEKNKIDNLIYKQKTLIEKLKEYRASIISHAVTGKIDVREFGA
ncbi:restriction endonuclease subunit S [Acinetobacter junii]|uniref:restriction endonuclease subunit S n=1 Tax=Acinetobacter junii TaxID=40215 RepID=UPI001F341E54|nr:restriction endonuclease subunit S [Acinetobacter junii]MCE6003123.1 restriction endonuclease subunit S [Acinetobacter junii]